MTEGADLAALAGHFGARLRGAGIAVTPERAGTFARAVLLTEAATLPELYWCARVTLVSRLEEVAAFDTAFWAVFGGRADPVGERGDPNAPALPPPATAPRATAANGAPVPPAGPAGGARHGLDWTGQQPGSGRAVAVPGLASDEERLASRDFAELDREQLARLRGAMSALLRATPTRLSRRTRRHRRGSHLDLRATLRRSRRSGADPVRRLRRRRRPRPRRLILLLDISGSMEPYAQAYLQLLHCAARTSRAEGFTFATRLTRLTRLLRSATPAAALERAGRAAPDWSGGTRIGPALQAFLDRYGRRGLAHGAVVLVVSDGWERGDPALVGAQMARLARLAHRVVWVNPRKAAEGFQPLAGGMAAALPYCDALVSGHSLEAMAEVARALAPDCAAGPAPGP